MFSRILTVRNYDFFHNSFFDKGLQIVCCLIKHLYRHLLSILISIENFYIIEVYFDKFFFVDS